MWNSPFGYVHFGGRIAAAHRFGRASAVGITPACFGMQVFSFLMEILAFLTVMYYHGEKRRKEP